MARRAGAAVGLGYRRSSSLAASRIAFSTRGDGGRGDSLVLSFTHPSSSGGCSPGTYGSKPSRVFLRKLFGIRARTSQVRGGGSRSAQGNRACRTRAPEAEPTALARDLDSPTF